MLTFSFQFRLASPAFQAYTTIRAYVLRLSRPSTDTLPFWPAIQRAINWNQNLESGTKETLERAAVQRQAVMLDELTSGPHAPQPCHHSLRANTQLACHLHHQHTLPALQFAYASRHLALRPT